MRILIVLTIIGSLLTGLGHGLSAAVSSYTSAVEQRTLELQCVDQHIASGVERIDIGTVDGTCYVSTNAYYSN